MIRLTLDIKKKCSFFWLRGINNARIDKCCAKCFSGIKFNEVYEQTYFKDKAHVELSLLPDVRVKAYYLCGLSHGFRYDDNTHVAFVPDEEKNIVIDNDKIHLEITGAREIHFQDYKPNPVGNFTVEQRACRNWIFANYLLDGMPL